MPKIETHVTINPIGDTTVKLSEDKSSPDIASIKIHGTPGNTPVNINFNLSINIH